MDTVYYDTVGIMRTSGILSVDASLKWFLAVLVGVRDAALVHYPSSTDSIKPTAIFM
jgi:hypothetical protein